MNAILAGLSYFEGGAVGQIFSYWEQAGFFTYLLPFLLIFTLVFAILSRTNFFQNNKVINGIIALVVGLMSLQYPLIPQFFSKIFPQLGVGLAVILAIFILFGLFMDPDNKAVKLIFVIVGAVITIVILVQTFGMNSLISGNVFVERWPEILGIVIFLVLIGVVVGAGSGKGKFKVPNINPFALRDFQR